MGSVEFAEDLGSELDRGPQNLNKSDPLPSIARHRFWQVDGTSVRSFPDNMEGTDTPAPWARMQNCYRKFRSVPDAVRARNLFLGSESSNVFDQRIDLIF